MRHYLFDSDINPLAPKNGADNDHFANASAEKRARPNPNPSTSRHPEKKNFAGTERYSGTASDQVIQRLRGELEPMLRQMARRAAADEHERTREWLEHSGLPKAARVAQRETYDVLRRNGVIRDASRKTPGEAGGGAYVKPEPRQLSDSEVNELAEACVALFEVKGQPVEDTLRGMAVETGGILLREDAPRVLSKVRTLLGACRGDV